jgi:CheY-like chemotaxis protein
MSVAVASKLSDQANNFRRADGKKRRVLYAEDQASARIVTTALLERMGFDVEAVEDGELALEKAMHTAYDVILLDIEMPVMDGVTAARNIRAEAGLCRETPILALSAFLADSTDILFGGMRLIVLCQSPRTAMNCKKLCTMRCKQGHAWKLNNHPTGIC